MYTNKDEFQKIDLNETLKSKKSKSTDNVGPDSNPAGDLRDSDPAGDLQALVKPAEEAGGIMTPHHEDLADLTPPEEITNIEGFIDSAVASLQGYIRPLPGNENNISVLHSNLREFNTLYQSGWDISSENKDPISKQLASKLYDPKHDKATLEKITLRIWKECNSYDKAIIYKRGAKETSMAKPLTIVYYYLAAMIYGIASRFSNSTQSLAGYILQENFAHTAQQIKPLPNLRIKAVQTQAAKGARFAQKTKKTRPQKGITADRPASRPDNKPTDGRRPH